MDQQQMRRHRTLLRHRLIPQYGPFRTILDTARANARINRYEQR